MTSTSTTSFVPKDSSAWGRRVVADNNDRLLVVLIGGRRPRWSQWTPPVESRSLLRNDPTAWHVLDTGHFSLAGAQAKTALHYDKRTGRWGEPSGAVPTTHILKPAVTGLDDHDLNEHICLGAALLLGLSAASSHVASFGPERVIVVERYDRFWATDDSCRR
jgi:serine/threonine-protein kinase HipA